MMPGMIMLWYGSVASIPSGWTLCDGNNGTPDLRGKFIKGAGPIPHIPGSTGGANSHIHPFTGDGHDHDIIPGTSISNDPATLNYDHHTSVSPATGDTDSADSRPPFHALCYIMKTPIP